MARYAETAQRLAYGFDTITAHDGSTRVIIRAEDGTPDGNTLRAMVFAVNDDLYWDDAYEMTQDALQQIADTDPDEISETDRDGLIEIYTAPLMQWLARNWTLADAMKDEYGTWPDTLHDIATMTQDYAYGLVLGAIERNWPNESDDYDPDQDEQHKPDPDVQTAAHHPESR